jgi:hypothetical protein
MKRTAKPLYEARLPSTGVTTEVYDKVLAIATKEGVSLAAVTRRAIDFFLMSNSPNPRDNSPIGGDAGE